MSLDHRMAGVPFRTCGPLWVSVQADSVILEQISGTLQVKRGAWSEIMYPSRVHKMELTGHDHGEMLFFRSQCNIFPESHRIKKGFWR